MAVSNLGQPFELLHSRKAIEDMVQLPVVPAAPGAFAFGPSGLAFHNPKTGGRAFEERDSHKAGDLKGEAGM